MSNTIYIVICVILSIAVLVGISLMSKVKTAVAGNLLSALSVFAGMVVTLLHYNIVSVWSIYLYILIGVLIGSVLAVRVKMIQMPQLVALLNGIGGIAAALVGILSLLGIGVPDGGYPAFERFTAMLAVVVGLVTFTGSMVAAGKLHKLLPQKPVILKNHEALLKISLVIMIGVILFSAFPIDNTFWIAVVLIVSIVVSSFFGYAFTIRVGGADMPITISLLISLSGVAGAIAGMALNDLLLVSVGGIVGASGLLLTQIMCRAMNRKLVDILTGKTSVAKPTTELPETEEKAEVTQETDAEILKSAKTAIIVPGYGMALAQAQLLVRQLADKLEANGTNVKYAIHPVAGRMPGHMNVLLAEADVPYEQLYEMEAINDQFVETDIVIVIGANDVINPAARDAKDTPIYGMPVLNVDHAREVFICNYDLNPGYAGVDNPLYKRNHGIHLLIGDAKDSLGRIIDQIGPGNPM
ncbi:NAD(P)(+) transhydrogenase (Re/Si-specific) subunit beta [Proteiniphilum sp. UBA5384]|uniref:NAD(P)(+) transhydrogenase (Re/Si-specific) subunit beta n=1 Tax=Proteiniphilum sp. UBA5384 TaxID=1947279 RepID=UPI0025EF6F16|nr:NAD(P)(+) transhydrogenase (Re/Si-specific) subunit beta [Proteiniphilum sp. UBA5384]